MAESTEYAPLPLGRDAADLLTLLDVEEIGIDTYRGISPVLAGRRNIFGGQVMAQALRAAAATVNPQCPPHSLHAYFLRSGRFEEDVHFAVERTRDGRSFATRQVQARQGDQVIFTLSASFQRDEPGREFATPMRDIAGPPDADWADPVQERSSGIGLDITSRHRLVDPADQPAYLVWVRTRGTIPEDRVLNACIAAYISDLGAGGLTATVVDLPMDNAAGLMMASLDHAMWFHRPIRADHWHLVDAVPVSVAGSRGLIRGTMHDVDGHHVASFAQELLVRELGD